MTGDTYGWAGRFRGIYDKGAAALERGDKEWRGWFSAEEVRFLEGIGVRAHDLFDYVEDRRDLDFASALLIVAVRRDYFREVQGGVVSERRVTDPEMPGRKEKLAGIEWLPRILAKARARLQGELDDALMFGCGGDRGFLRRRGIEPADFLRAVWRAGEDEGAVVAFVREAGK